MRTWRAAGLVLLACGALSGCGPRAAPPPAWFGQVLPLSGPDRVAGESARRGTRLAVEEAAETRIAGRQVGALFADGRGEDEPTRAAMVRLLAVNRVAALLGGPRAACGEALAVEAQPYAVPVILTTELRAAVRGDTLFSLAARPEARGRALAAQVARLPGVERVAVLTDEHDPIAVAVAKAFVDECRKTGRPAVQEWPVRGPRSDDDLKAVVAARPGAALLAVGPSDFARLRARLAAAGFACPALYGGEDAGPEELRGSVGVVVFATAYHASGLSERGRAFAQRYTEQYREPPGLHAALSYEAGRLLIEAMQQSNSLVATRVRDQLARTETFEGVTGPLTLKDRTARRRLFVVELEDGRERSVTTVAAESE
jgi:branched-chain amino acid transport system substrate-binding protein